MYVCSFWEVVGEVMNLMYGRDGQQDVTGAVLTVRLEMMMI